MPRLTRLARLAALIAAASAFLAPAAQAAPPPWLFETVTTEHFQIHFTGDNLVDDGAHPTIRQWNGEFAAVAEWAYSTYTSQWGFPAHVADTDGLIDVYVFDLEKWYGESWEGVAGVTFASSGANQTAATIEIDDESIRDPHVAAHEVFHVIQLAMYSGVPGSFAESTAEWATFRLFDYRPDPWLSPHEPDNSIDCTAAGAGWPCGLDGYESGGYSRWTWWQYLGERYGQGIVKEVWDRVVTQASPSYDGDDALRDVLVGKGASLTDVFNDFSLAYLTGNFAAENLKDLEPSIHKTVETPDVTKPLAKFEVAVNRLASRYVAFQPPVGGEGPCYAATLTLNVTVPAGTSARPYLYFPDSKVKTPLSISGSSATVTTAWDTCSSQSPAILSLPNASQTLDGRLFFISGTVTVDTSKVVSGRTPPAGATVTGPIVAAPTEEPAPTLFLYAPGVLRVLGTARSLGFVVYSTGSGTLQASFAGTDLAAVKLRAGINRIVVRLPKPAATLAFASKPVLELTSMSPTGKKGATLTQKVAFKQKAKAKPKRKKP
jgi:hypothetical protein